MAVIADTDEVSTPTSYDRRNPNNIKCNDLHSGFSQRTDDADERTNIEACCKGADFPAANHHRESRPYVSDKTNDLLSKMEIRCTYHHQCARSRKLNVGYSANTTKQQCKMRWPCESYISSSFAKSHLQRTLRLCSETSNYQLSRLCSIFSNSASGCKALEKATVSTRTSNKWPLLNNSLSIYFITFILLLTTTDLVVGRRQQHRRGGGGPRLTRDSGFNRGAIRSAFSSQKCEDITVPLCKDIGYNQTDMSLSLMNKFTQAEAKAEVSTINVISFDMEQCGRLIDVEG